MMDNVSLGDLAAVLALFGGIFVWVIRSYTEPIKDLLQRTIDALNRLSALMDEEQSMRQRLELRLQKIEDRAASNTHRIDSIEEQQKKCLSEKSLIN